MRVRACVWSRRQVDTYLAWLEDSDFDDPSRCQLCHEVRPNQLRCERSTAPCVCCGGAQVLRTSAVRLTCLHLYHASCLDRHLAALPANTAVDGYCCPKCLTPVIPTGDPATLVRYRASHLSMDPLHVHTRTVAACC